MKYQKQLREVKVDLKKEYQQHLECMSKLDSFKNLGIGWDHNFYKAVIGASVKE